MNMNSRKIPAGTIPNATASTVRFSATKATMSPPFASSAGGVRDPRNMFSRPTNKAKAIPVKPAHRLGENTATCFVEMASNATE
jgi:hypothetical protein